MATRLDIRDPALKVHGRGWRKIKTGRLVETSETGDISYLLKEEHHHRYGRPWIFGRHYMDFLVSDGLKPSHRILDFGCGAGRVGIWLVGYLDAGNYVGIDHDWNALHAFAEYEIPLHGLGDRNAHLILDGSLSVSDLGPFDAILDFAVSNHLTRSNRFKLYGEFSKAIKPGGTIFKTHDHWLSEDQFRSVGLRPIRSAVTQCSFLKHDLTGLSTTPWTMLARIGS